MEFFGSALLESYRGLKVALYIRRDDGSIEPLELAGFFSKYDEWPLHEREALKYVKGRVVDVGCGAGRHTLWLQERGYDVVGLDISYRAARVASMRGVSNLAVGHAIHLPFRREAFDTALLLGGNLGIAGSIRGTVRVLEELHRITCSNGILIASTHNPLKAVDSKTSAYILRNKRLGRPLGQVFLQFKLGDRVSSWFKWINYTPEEVKELALRTRWKIIDIIENGESTEYSIVMGKCSW